MFFLIILNGIDTMEQCTTYALMDPCPGRGTLDVEVVASLQGDTRLVDVGLHQTIGRIGLGGHHTIEVVEEHTVRVHLKHATFGCELQSNVLHIIFDVLDTCEVDLASYNKLCAQHTMRLMCTYSMDVRLALGVYTISKAIMLLASFSSKFDGVKTSLTRLQKYKKAS